MKYIENDKNLKLRNTVVTLGKFDGIHIGHQDLIDQVILYKKQGYKGVMFTFSYHPSNLVSKEEIKLIYTEEEKIEKVKSRGIDVLVSYPFTKETMSIEGEDFIKKVLIERLDAKYIVVGEDFRFGYKRRGDISLLKELEDKFGYKTIVCEKKKWNNQVVSSSRIRSKLSEGKLRQVNSMLGQPYSIHGEVKHGSKIARALGMPTTNIIPNAEKFLPASGVYVSKAIIEGESYPGVTYIGLKPTVGEANQRVVETFIFDFNQNLYGKKIGVELYDFIRPEEKFDSVDKLKKAMERDTKKAKEYF